MRGNMKKLTIPLAVLVTGLALAACGGDDESQPETTTPVTAPAGATAVTGATGLTGTTGTTGASGTTGTTPSGTSPTTEELDGNQMGDDNTGGSPQVSTQSPGGNGNGSSASPKPKKSAKLPSQGGKSDPSLYSE